MSASTLHQLADRAEAGSGYDQALRTDIVAALGLQRNWGPLLVSVEAVEGIRLDRCPSSHLECWVFRDFTSCTIHIDGQKPATAKAPTEPRARLAALLRAIAGGVDG